VSSFAFPHHVLYLDVGIKFCNETLQVPMSGPVAFEVIISILARSFGVEGGSSEFKLPYFKKAEDVLYQQIDAIFKCCAY
jgi:hypothetical protein